MGLLDEASGRQTHSELHTKKMQDQLESMRTAVQSLETKTAASCGIGDADFKLITGAYFSNGDKANKRIKPSIEALLEAGYNGNGFVHSIIRKVGQVASQIPWVAQSSTNGVDWEDAPDSALQKIINKPNSKLTANQFRMDSMTWLLGTGNYYVTTGQSLVFEDEISDMHILESNLITIETENGKIKRYKYNLLNGTEKYYKPEELVHVKFLDPSMQGHISHLGMSPIEAGWNTLKASNHHSIADANLLENQGVAGILSHDSDVQVMTEPDRKKLQIATDDVMEGVDKVGKRLVSKTPVKYTPIGLDSNQLQMVQGGTIKKRDLCTFFGVHSAMFNDNENSTLDNMKIAEKKLYTDSAIPNNDVLLRVFEQYIIPKLEVEDGVKFRVIQDVSEIPALQADQNEKSKKDAKNTETVIKIIDSRMNEKAKIIMLMKLGIEEKEAEEMVKVEEVEPIEPVIPAAPAAEEEEEIKPEEEE